MKELAFASIKTVQEWLVRKKVSSDELLDLCLQRFARYDGTLGTALEIFDAPSIMSSSAPSGSLQAIPGIVKDNICQQGRIASCSSKILATYRAPYDATAIARLKAQGAYILGRANCDEFAMGSSTETSAYKKTANPWDITRVPGGSSGGSAAAVAAGLVPWALGSDTGGSVRQPAALCGIVGSKPTYGLVSRYGLIAYASSFDQIGVFTRTVYDNALLLSLLAGTDSSDSTTLAVKNIDYTKSLTGKLKNGLTIGVVDNAVNAHGIDPDVSRALNASLHEFEKLGARIVHVTLPTMDYGAAVYFMISRAEAASNLARFDGVRYGVRAQGVTTLAELYAETRGQGFGKEVKRRILIGNYVLSVGHADQYYKSARIVQGLMRAEFLDAFKNVDLLFVPTSPAGAFKFGAFDNDKLQMDLQDYFTAPANLTGIPALSVPCGFTQDRLPIGFQLFGPDLSEELIFQTAYAYEAVTPWHTMHPEQFK
jgi:aspartyl-tRNA(Asn)/glutamyl-tRNA(Gln) amidotransferase subunit A